MEYTCVNSVYPEMKIKQKGDIVNYYSLNHNGHLIKLECNIETHEMRTFKKILNTNKFVALSHNKIDDNDRIEIYGEGDRWEGDSFNGIPFGYGHFYDDEGNRMYSGFLYKGKKVGYGTEYFADTHTIDYCGHFMNDKRHGWGISYDRNGTKLYEGEWRFGFNHYSKYTVTRENENMNIFSSDIQELVIEDYCFDMVGWIESIVPDNEEDEFLLEFLRQELKASGRKEKLPFLIDNEDHVLIDGFAAAYMSRMGIFQGSTHIFDEISEIQEVLENHPINGKHLFNRADYHFEKSHNSQWLQLCDIIAGIMASFFTFANRVTVEEFVPIIGILTEQQKRNLALLHRLMKKSIDKNTFFAQKSNVFSQTEVCVLIEKVAEYFYNKK